MTENIKQKNKQIIAEAFSQAFCEPDTKTELHQRIFGKYTTPKNNSDDMTPKNNSDDTSEQNLSEFQKLREHSQDFRNFAKERINIEFSKREKNKQEQK